MLGVGPAGPLPSSGEPIEGARPGGAARDEPGGDHRAVDHPVADPPPGDHPVAEPSRPAPGARMLRSFVDGLSEVEAWAILASADGVGPVGFADLLGRSGSARAVLAAASRVGRAALPAGADPGPERRPGRANAEDGRGSGGRDPLAAVGAALARGPALLAAIRSSGLEILTLEDERYPRRLRAIELSPPVLFVQGDIGSLRSPRAVAVVGTRRPTERGRRLGALIAGAIARRGAAVVSGLALGIDGVAHAAALEEDAPTIAVLGSGHDRLSPAAHRSLALRIVRSGGAVVSEFVPGVPPARHTFPRRNRIVSGLAEATVVVEAGEGSGALITAAWALEQGRECFLVPGPLGERSTAGNLRFLRDHSGLARVVAGIPELLEDLELSPAPRSGLPDPDPMTSSDDWLGAGLGAAERDVAIAVAGGAFDADAVVACTGLAPASVLGALTRLEVRGLVVEALGRFRPAGRLSTRVAPPPAGRRPGR
jgi:DNA processing protein